jgi:hypothetical protein
MEKRERGPIRRGERGRERGKGKMSNAFKEGAVSTRLPTITRKK